MQEYYNEGGKLVFTEEYLWNRGYCCGSGCRHCPFLYQNVKDPKRKEELIKAQYDRKKQELPR